MSERYDPRTGSLEPKTDFALPTLDDIQRARVGDLLSATTNKRSRKLPKDPANYATWIDEQEKQAQGQLQRLHEAGIDFDGASLMINFRDADLSLDALLEVMNDKLYDGAGNQGDFIKGFQQRQDLPTGGIALADGKLQMRGLSYWAMMEKVASLNNRIRLAKVGRATLLGIVPGLQLYYQSPSVQAEMRGLGQYTPDVTAGDIVAGLDDWHGSGRVDANRWGGEGYSNFGSRVAVVKKP